MRGGQYADSITIETVTTTADGRGGFAATWATLATVPAQSEPLSAREQLQAESIGSRLVQRFTIRWRADVAAQQRVVWRSRRGGVATTFQIHGVLETPDRQSLVLSCAVVQ